MKLITLISLFILLSVSYELDYTQEFDKELQKPITIEVSDASATITFKALNIENIHTVPDTTNDAAYITIKDIKADVKSKFKVKRLFTRHASTKGEIKITIKTGFKVEYKDGSADGIFFKATMNDFKIDVDLNSVYGSLSKKFKKVAESLKNQIKEQILIKFERKKLEKILINDFKGLFNMYN